MMRRGAVMVIFTMLMSMVWALPVLAQDAPTQTPSTQVGSQEISQTLEALRTLLQNTESRLEHVETRLDAQDERINLLQGTVRDLQQRVEGQMSILNESIQRQRSRLQKLQTLVILGGAVALLLVIGGGIVLYRGRSQGKRSGEE